MNTIELIGVPFDGMGRSGGQANAPQVLRDAGLIEAFQRKALIVKPDMILPKPTSQRSSGSGFINEPALLHMNAQLHTMVSETLQSGDFPFIYGGDCSVLLATIPALRNVKKKAGLLFIDGHEDSTPLEISPDGEVANMEIALLLGQSSELTPKQIRDKLPALKYNALAMLGPRDKILRDKLKVPTLSDKVFLRTSKDLYINLESQTLEAADHIQRNSNGWWLHIDLDVLSLDEFSSRGEAGEGGLSGGLSWKELEKIVATALKVDGCCGCSLVIFNPDRDIEGKDAKNIIRFVNAISSSLP